VNILKPGARARVVSVGKETFSSSPASSEGNEFIDGGSLVTVIGVAVEKAGLRWWPVEADDGRSGWMPEGRSNITMLAPLCPVEHIEAADVTFYYIDPALGTSNLYTSDFEGESVCNITYETVNSQRSLPFAGEAKLSSDGSQIAVLRNTAPEEPGVTVLQADGSGISEVNADLYIRDFVISPDGEKVVMAGSLVWQQSQQIWAAFTDGMELRVVTTESAYHTHPDWSPDSTRILYIQEPLSEGDSSKLGVIGFDGGHPLSLDTSTSIATGAWSLDGETIAVHYSDGRLAVIDAETGATLRENAADDSLAFIGDVVWSLDGETLLVIGVHESASGLVLYGFDAQTFAATHTIPLEGCEEQQTDSLSFVAGDDDTAYVVMADCVVGVNLADNTSNRVLNLQDGMLNFSLRR